eukprot:PLAT3853.2.p1 GENE.PLAT3853.2~~PLAT3853.2.p1  ORF type:complete len:1731 (+),score=-603.49 PLAT3853.2:53-5194(+)
MAEITHSNYGEVAEALYRSDEFDEHVREIELLQPSAIYDDPKPLPPIEDMYARKEGSLKNDLPFVMTDLMFEGETVRFEGAEPGENLRAPSWLELYKVKNKRKEWDDPGSLIPCEEPAVHEMHEFLWEYAPNKPDSIRCESKYCDQPTYCQSIRSMSDSWMEEINNTRMRSVLKYYKRVSQQMLGMGMHKDRTRGNNVRYLKTSTPDIVTIVYKSTPLKRREYDIKYIQLFKGNCAPMGPTINKRRDHDWTRTKWRSITASGLSQCSECEYKTISMYVWARSQGVTQEQARWMTTLTFMLSLSRNSELVNTLALQRYISVSQFGHAHNIPQLIMDKMPKRCSSTLCSFIMKRMHDKASAAATIEKKSESKGLEDFTEEDVKYKFSAELSFFGFETDNIQVYLAETYLSHLCSDMLRNSQHNYNRFVETMKEYESKEEDYFEFDEEAVRLTAKAFKMVFLENNVSVPRYEDEPVTVLTRSKGVLSMFDRDRSVKLYDEVVRLCKGSGSIPTVKQLASNYDNKMRFCLLEKRQKQEAREIFKTELSCLAKLRIVERQAHGYCSWSGIEYITKSGDQKYFTFQNCVHQIERAEAPVKVYRTSDSSKWSTGDNPDIMKIIAEEMFDEPCTRFFESVRNRHLVPGNEYTRRALKKHDLPDEWILKNGWPQGFFNKMSSLKHVLMCTYALALYMVKSKRWNSGRIEVGCHSDDYYYAAAFPDESEVFLWESCLSTARRKFCIRENTKKSSASNHFCEFLSIFSVHGSIIAPQFKHVCGIMKDRPGNGYTADLHSMMSRVRECMRFDVPDYWVSWAMDYCVKDVRKDYSMLEGMVNHMEGEFVWPEHMAGWFHCTPVTLLLFGNKGNIYRVARHTPDGMQACYTLVPGQYPIDENDGDDVEMDTDFNFMFLYPKVNACIPSRWEIVRRKIGYMEVAKPKKYEMICKEAMTPQRQFEIAYWYIWSGSARRMYSTVESGLMRYYVTRLVRARCMNWNDERVTMRQAYERLRKHARDNYIIPNVSTEGIMSALLGFSTALSAYDGTYLEPLSIGNPRRVEPPISILSKIDLFQPGLRGLKLSPMDFIPYCTFLPDYSPDHPLSNEKIFVIQNMLKDILHKDKIENESDLELLVRISSSRLKGNKYMFLKTTRFIEGYKSLDYFLADYMRVSGVYERDVRVGDMKMKDTLSIAETWRRGRFVISSTRESDFLLSVYNSVCAGVIPIASLRKFSLHGDRISKVIREASMRLASSRSFLTRLSRSLMWYRTWGFVEETEHLYKAWKSNNAWRVNENRVSNRNSSLFAIKGNDGNFRLNRNNCYSRGALTEISYLIQCAYNNVSPCMFEFMMLGPRLIDETEGQLYIKTDGGLEDREGRGGITGLAPGRSEDIPVTSFGKYIVVDVCADYKWNEREQRCERIVGDKMRVVYPRLEVCGPGVGAQHEDIEHFSDLISGGFFSPDKFVSVGARTVVNLNIKGTSSSIERAVRKKYDRKYDDEFFESIAGVAPETAHPEISISASAHSELGWYEGDLIGDRLESAGIEFSVVSDSDRGVSESKESRRVTAEESIDSIMAGLLDMGGIMDFTLDDFTAVDEISTRDRRFEYMNLSPAAKRTMSIFRDARYDWSPRSRYELSGLIARLRCSDYWKESVKRKWALHMMAQVSLMCCLDFCKDALSGPSHLEPQDYMWHCMQEKRLVSGKCWQFIQESYKWDEIEYDEGNPYLI